MFYMIPPYIVKREKSQVLNFKLLLISKLFLSKFINLTDENIL